MLRRLVPVWIKHPLKGLAVRFGWLDPGGVYVFFVVHHPPNGGELVRRRFQVRAINREFALRFLARDYLGVRLDRWEIDGPHSETVARR